MSTRASRLLTAALALMLSFTPALLPAQTADEQQAQALILAARKEQDAKNHPVAIQRYREFLTKYANHKDAPAARFGLGRCLLDNPGPDYAGAVEQLKQIADNKDLPDHPVVLYYFGIARRGLGLKELAQVPGKPQQEAEKHQAAARQHFEDAAKQFAGSAAAYAARAPKGNEGQPDREAAVRSRCDQAEMLLHIDQAKAARELVAPLLTDAALEKTRLLGLARYYSGWASFALEDYNGAGRALSLLAPFDDPNFAVHARFLLARVHHIQDERAEAAAQYEAVLAQFDKQKKEAPAELQRPPIRKDPAERARREALLNEPPPEYVARSMFYLGVLHFEAGRFADAQQRFTVFAQQFPRSPLVAAAHMRLGAAQVEARQFPEAVRTLQPLVEKEPALADQTLYWLARAWTGLIDPKNPQANPQALQGALEAQRGAADKARARAANDPEAKARLGQIMLDRSDLLLLAGQHREAVATLRQIGTDQLLPENRQDEVLQRLAAALNLAGDYVESDKICTRFIKEHGRSALLPVVLFRSAENAAFQYVEAERSGSPELGRLNDEVAKRYQLLLDRYPEFEHASRARFALAMCLFRKGDIEKARAMMESIPQSDYNDDLAVVPYLLTDWTIRLTPMRADDALQAAKMQEHLTAAVAMLQAFVDAQPKGPLTPDALLKLGLCKQRLALIQEKPQDRVNMLGSAGRRFDRLIQTFPQDERIPQARLEKARCRVLAGDAGGIEDLRAFLNDPALKNSRVAPLAVLQLATVLRSQNKPADAAAALAQCRQDQEAALLKDKARAGWVAQLRCQQGVSLKEAGRFADARGILESVVKDYPDRPEAAEATLRIGQCLKDEALAKLVGPRQVLASPTAKPEEIAAALQFLDAETKNLRSAVDYLEKQAEALKKKHAESEARARVLYEAAWGCRILADIETAAARNKLVREGHKEGQPIPPLSEAAADRLPVPATEKKVRELYLALIADFADLPLANDARLELSEILSGRGEHEAAAKLIDQALDKEPPQDLTDKLRLQLGLCRAMKGDVKSALEQFAPMEKNPKSPAFGQAHLWAGEALMRAGDWQGAVKHLAPFRDQQPLRNLPGITDRALLRLGQAHAQLKQWDQSRQAYERLVNEHGNSPLVAEARYGMGSAWQQQKDHENAVNAFLKAAESPTRTGARAQLQAGLSRLEQKRYADAATLLKVVASRYAYPELSAAALLEAARAHADLKQKDEAEKLLGQVAREQAQGTWADAAAAQLKALKDGVALQRPAAIDGVVVVEGKQPLALPELGQAIADRASLDDGTAEQSMALALGGLPAINKTPVPFLRVTLPDPFEFRASNRIEVGQVKNPAATLPAWPAGS